MRTHSLIKLILDTYLPLHTNQLGRRPAAAAAAAAARGGRLHCVLCGGEKSCCQLIKQTK